MLNDIRLAVESSPNAAMTRTLYKGVYDDNVARTGDGAIDTLYVFAKDSNNQVIGGIVGSAYWGWVNISSVWVSPVYRRQGLASRMLAMIEQEAISKGCKHAYLDTFTFQSPALYEKSGYQIIGTLPDFPPGHARHFMSKDLIPTAERDPARLRAVDVAS
ncbi:GNAT superfamily N-acetyltransferase [Chitinivorax tropicus]|uniref:GNAT superfamily N-acetyltransferase n=1 Tax=Chitinivorax tropicus TaxID=714531 RepID=A0A840MK94_9PROT|nr:GNAT family N-acetyltransferase [Chitinivorax tropicus]MBB5016986.1 GNAT superfamily N-acetyltransferase [Chitinivorax tropicus]